MNTSIVYLEDCVKGLKRFNDKHFDLAIVDPPYGIGADTAQNKAALQRINSGGKNKSGRGWRLYEDTNWDDATPSQEYFDELFRVSKNQIIWGGNYFTLFLPPSNAWIVWDKMQREFSLADGEMAWTSFDHVLKIFKLSRGEATVQHNKNGGRFHPTQKPEGLYEWLLQQYAYEGLNVLDTHLGSGTSRIAAYKAGVNFVGFEINETYYQKQENTFKKIIKQQNLF